MHCILKTNIIYNGAPNKGCLNCHCSAILLHSNLSNSFRSCKETSSENTSPLWPQSHLLTWILYENFMKPWQMVKVLLGLGRIYVSNNYSISSNTFSTHEEITDHLSLLPSKCSLIRNVLSESFKASWVESDYAENDAWNLNLQENLDDFAKCHKIKDGIKPRKSGFVIYYEGNLFFSCKKENNQLSENIFNLWI